MSGDDPFALPDNERTVIMPAPGGRRPPAAAPPAGDGALQAPSDAGGLNPLVAAANPLLDLVPQLRATLHHPDPARLREALAEAVRAFETRAREGGARAEHIVGARYALCSLLDEAAAGTPWGGAGTWASQSLLVLFHNEAWGGEKFFLLLSTLARDPRANLDLLELMYVCLALGFKGRYQVQDNGMAALDALRERLAGMLRRQRGEYERALSPHWQGAGAARRTLSTALPLWIALAVLSLLAALAYLAFSLALNRHSDPVYARIAALGRPEFAAAGPAANPAAGPASNPAAAPLSAETRLAPLLAPDVAAGTLSVRDEAGRSVVTLRGDGLFTPGGARVADGYGAALQHVGRALRAVPGPVRVLGHTDAQPIRSARFPSNWHLSQARAEAVAALLAAQAPPPQRYSAEGLADTEPLGPNTTAQDRARNRRVDIVLTPKAAEAR
ncbi:DotU family type VI secretion system protein [Pseudoduganella namucuonensis]|uniref:Type VI secretion system protein ImpK n=1 Tax=Pseudoduganella namucuonensis TaxID=1035707 RepID=A0A1I7KPC9_9BURK|nr:DotU family type VI secretion system protein [Pseudoduganella namucuonensis]SFU99297.1 type VI secretion system protein ImpK [Pseudoduganella namucuonensis]